MHPRHDDGETSAEVDRAARRTRFLEAMGSGVAVLKTSTVKKRNIHHEYPFRADSDFYYLTGCELPGTMALFTPEQTPHYTLFVPPRDADAERWDGLRLDPADAQRRYGADAVHTSDRFLAELEASLSLSGRFFHHFGPDPRFDREIIDLMERRRPLARRGAPAPNEILDPHSILQWSRLEKDASDLRALEKAAEATAAGHRAVMAATRPGVWEYELEALLAYHFRRSGGSGHAYAPIVAGGGNATRLHYTRNDCQLAAGTLLLVDAGAEFDCYACDVTRTLPVSDRFSAAQARLYDVVLRAQKAVLAAVRPGLEQPELQRIAATSLTEGLVDLGLLPGPTSVELERQGYKRFYMHQVGHWIGLDTHDACPYATRDGAPVRLGPGMVFTVEPGLYIDDHDDVPAEYRGVGIRIEDDVLVTESGHRVLTATIPKERQELEEALAARPTLQPGKLLQVPDGGLDHLQ